VTSVAEVHAILEKLLLRNESSSLEILAIWHGGMASHGGILGLVTAILIFAWKRGLNPLIFLYAAAVTRPLGIALGRMANFINGELWGRSTSIPWAVIFPKAPTVNWVGVPRHPSQLYAAGMEGLLVLAMAQWIEGPSTERSVHFVASQSGWYRAT